MYKEEMQKLFDDLPTNTPIEIIHNSYHENTKGIIVSKTKHSDYSYSVFVHSLCGKYGKYMWIKPKYVDYFSKKVEGFKLIDNKKEVV